MPRTEPAPETTEETEPPAWLFPLLRHLEAQTASGDLRAGLVLIADAILLAGLVVVAAGDESLLAEAARGTKALIGIAFVALCAGLVLALQAIMPSRRDLLATNRAGSPGALLQFSRIAEPHADVYVQRALAARRGALDRDLAQTVHHTSRWARRKFWLLYVAVVCTTTGVCAAAGAAAVEAMTRSSS